MAKNKKDLDLADSSNLNLGTSICDGPPRIISLPYTVRVLPVDWSKTPNSFRSRSAVGRPIIKSLE